MNQKWQQLWEKSLCQDSPFAELESGVSANSNMGSIPKTTKVEVPRPDDSQQLLNFELTRNCSDRSLPRTGLCLWFRFEWPTPGCGAEPGLLGSCELRGCRAQSVWRVWRSCLRSRLQVHDVVLVTAPPLTSPWVEWPCLLLSPPPLPDPEGSVLHLVHSGA